MAITKTIVVNADLKKAQEEFDAFDRSVKDTNESIQTLERDLLKLEKSLFLNFFLSLFQVWAFLPELCSWRFYSPSTDTC